MRRLERSRLDARAACAGRAAFTCCPGVLPRSAAQAGASPMPSPFRARRSRHQLTRCCLLPEPNPLQGDRHQHGPVRRAVLGRGPGRLPVLRRQDLWRLAEELWRHQLPGWVAAGALGAPALPRLVPGAGRPTQPADARRAATAHGASPARPSFSRRPAWCVRARHQALLRPVGAGLCAARHLTLLQRGAAAGAGAGGWGSAGALLGVGC